MHGLAVKLTDYLIENGVEEEAVREKSIYGFEMIFSKVLGYGTLLILGIILHKWIHTILFLLTFGTLRKRTGGFHMRTEIGCYIVSVVQYLIIMLLGDLSVIRLPMVQIEIVLISVLLITLLAPLNHPNWNLNPIEVKLCKQSARRRMILIALVVIVSVCMEWMPEYIPYITMGMGLDAGALLLGKIMKQEVNE